MVLEDNTTSDFVLKTLMSKAEYLEVLENPPGDLVGGPSITYKDETYVFAQLFKKPPMNQGGTRHRRKRNKKTRKAF